MNSFSKINFLGRQFNCPNNPEEYLEFAYGNWKVPLRSSDKDLYNSKSYKNKKKFILADIKQKILKKIYESWKLVKNYLST